MRLTVQYLAEFMLDFENPADVLLMVPRVVPLNGQEQHPNSSVMLNPPVDQPDLPMNLLIFRNDNNDDSRPWDIDPALRTTFVRLEGNTEIGYVFDGLVSDHDVRLWFRDFFDLEPEPIEDEPESEI